MEGIITLVAAVFGAIFGSFACCQAWRLRYKFEGKKDPGKRSVCMYCGVQLKWSENIPIVSWVVQRGRCRHCKRKIGYAEIMSEIGMAITGVVVAWVYIIPLVHEWNAGGMDVSWLALRAVEIVILCAIMVGLAVLAIYDGKWGELPTRLLSMCIAGAIIMMLLGQESYYLINHELDYGALLSTLGAAVILAGTCFALYRVSHETLMGGGDWMLALAIAFVLQDWWLALWVMMLANLLGSVIMAPVAMRRRGVSIHFGPFLMAAFVVVLAIQDILLGLVNF